MSNTYELTHQLGSGGMGEVFLAVQAGVGHVVLKRMRTELATDLESLRLFIDEAKVAARLNHPNVVRIDGLGRRGDSYFLVMEHVDGLDLAALLKLLHRERKVMPLPIAVGIVHQVLLGLQHAHDQGIVHRDVSPHNVLVSTSGVTKLTDFGIAKAANRLTKTRTGIIRGKASYMSPEQARGLPLDGRSDLYSVGLVLYEAATGRRAREGASDVSNLLEAIEHAEPSLVGAAPQLRLLLARACSENPDARFSSALAFAEELRDAVPEWAPPQKISEYLQTLTLPSPASLQTTASVEIDMLDAPSAPMTSGEPTRVGSNENVRDVIEGEETHLLAPDTVVDHYKVIRLAGRGGMSEVYLARDEQLGRKVALKLIQQDILRSRGVEQFLQEARTLAQLSHPNIVNVFGMGTFQGQAYMALEYVAGETLRERVESRQLSLREIERIALAIASALAEAHAHNILHGDLKPDNAIISPDGRLRVLDFGLAKLFDPERPSAQKPPVDGDDPVQSSFNGTPVYMSPEQWEGLARTPAIDMWAFGVILFELIAGKRPFDASDLAALANAITHPTPAPRIETRRELPEELAALVNACLDKDAAHRPSAVDAQRVLEQLVHRSGRILGEGESPFLGLSAFTEEHAAFFFGRDEETTAFIERVRSEPVLPVIGASGAGKSSFVQAGVIPRLRDDGEWAVVRMRPGADPFRTLASRFARLHDSSSHNTPNNNVAAEAVAEVNTLAKELYDNPQKLGLLLARRAKLERTKVLLLVDQLEEVCTLVADRETRLRFLSAICLAADDPRDPVRVVFTARDDFLTRLAESKEARAALTRVTVLRPPGEDALREIVTRPLNVAGYGYDDATLVDDMVRAVTGEAAALPLLQFCGTMLWERRDRVARTLKRSAYDGMGGVQGALATHANAVLRDFNERQIRIARDTMLRLLTPEGTRRVVPRQALVDALGTGSEEVILRLIDSRLLVVREGLETPSIEISHESLVHTWDRLAHWLEEGREELIFLSELEQAAALWDKRGRRRSEVWVGSALSEALRNMDRFRARVAPLSQAFLSASKKAESARRRLRRALVVGGATLLAIIATVSVVAAFRFAEKQRIAEEQRAQAQAEGARSAYQRGDYIAAQAQLRSSLEIADSARVRTLWWRLQGDPVTFRRKLPSTVYDLALFPDHSRVAAATLDGSIALVDLVTGSIDALRDMSGQAQGVAISADGQWLAAGYAAGEAALWRLSDNSMRVLRGHANIWRLEFSPDSKLLATAGFEGSVRVWDVDRAVEINRYDFADQQVWRAVFSPDGTSLAVGLGNGQVFLLDLKQQGNRVALKPAHAAQVTALAFSPSGDLLASGSADTSIFRWRNQQALPLLVGHTAGVNDLAFVDNQRLVSAGDDETLRVWNMTDGTLERTLREHTGGLSSVAVLDHDRVVTSGLSDQVLVQWDLRHADRQQASHGHTDAVRGARFSPDDSMIATSSADRTIKLWETASGRELKTLQGHHTDVIVSVAFSPDGKTIASASTDKTLGIWDVATGALVTVFRGHASGLFRAIFDGNDRVISVAQDGTVRVWSISRRQNLKTIDTGGILTNIVGNRTFGWIAQTTNGHLFWPNLDMPPLRRREGGGWGVAMAPDGKSYLLGGFTGTIEQLSIDGKPLHRYQAGTQQISEMAIDPTGTRAVAASIDTARIWDTAHPDTMQPLDHYSADTDSVQFDSTGSRLLTSDEANSVRLWDAKSRLPLWFGRAFLASSGHALTHLGWVSLRNDGVPTPPIDKMSRVKWASELDGRLCVLTEHGSAEDWTQSPIVLVEGPVQKLEASAGGCVVLTTDGAVTLGGKTLLAKGGRAVAVFGDAVAVAADGELVYITKDETRRYPIGAGASAVGVGRDWLAAGFSNGSVEVIRLADGSKRPLSLENQPSGRVARFLETPMRSLAVAYAGGTVGVWSLADGSELARMKLHGVPLTLHQQAGTLEVLTDLGDTGKIDLSALTADDCQLLFAVREAVGSEWIDGGPVRASGTRALRDGCRSH